MRCRGLPEFFHTYIMLKVMRRSLAAPHDFANYLYCSLYFFHYGNWKSADCVLFVKFRNNFGINSLFY